MRKKKWLIWLSLLLAVILIIAFIMMRLSTAVKVNAHQVTRGSITSTVSTAGIVQAKIYQLGTDLAGRVQWIGIKEGQNVKAGQILVKLDSYDNAAKDYYRMKTLFDQGFATSQQLENAKTVLNNKRIISPIKGMVTKSNLDPGEIAAPGQPMVTVVDVSRIWIEIQIDEADIQDARLGQNALIISDAYPDEEFAGKVEWINYEAELKKVAGIIRPDEEDKVFRARVVFEKKVQDKFKPGMSVDVDLEIQRKDGVITLPREAITTIDEKPYVYIIKDGHARLIPVELGLKTPVNLEITSGLSENDMVAVSNLSKLRDNIKVTTLP